MGGYIRIENIKKHNRVLKKNVDKLNNFLKSKSKTAIIEYSEQFGLYLQHILFLNSGLIFT